MYASHSKQIQFDHCTYENRVTENEVLTVVLTKEGTWNEYINMKYFVALT
jgi:hypothetical protein